MNPLFEAIGNALGMLFPPKSEILEIVGLSLFVSGCGLILSTCLGLTLGFFLAQINLSPNRFSTLLVNILHTWMALPAICIGLLVYLFFTRQGPLGSLGLLYTPQVMILAQGILATPIVASLSFVAFKQLGKEVRETILSLGANYLQMVLMLIKEARFALLAALITAFARIIGETGMTLLVGGNIKGYTRVMTTAIALETMKGNFELGIALGIILLIVAFIINFCLQRIQTK